MRLRCMCPATMLPGGTAAITVHRPGCPDAPFKQRVAYLMLAWIDRWLDCPELASTDNYRGLLRHHPSCIFQGGTKR